MSLTYKLKLLIHSAIGQKESADELITAVESGGTTYTGTANQIIVTGTVLSTPQNLNTTANVSFNSATIQNLASANSFEMDYGAYYQYAITDGTTGTASTLSSIETPVILINAGASLVSVTNINAPGVSSIGGINNVRVTIVNTGSSGVSFINNSGGTATQRIITGTGANRTMAAGASADFWYDGSRWRWIG